MKKLLSVALALAIAAGTMIVGTFAREIKMDESYSIGDVDRSGSVNAMDSVSLKATMTGAQGYICDAEAADFDADGKISAMDSFYMKACLAGGMSASSFESEHNVYKLLIAGYDISDFCIVVPAGCTKQDNAHYAAEKMQEYIEIATGFELDICYGSENRTKPHAIVYNMVALNSELGRELGYEGYKYDVTDGDLNIYGTARGNMYCTYDLLKRVGFVFYSDYYTFIWETRIIEICEGEGETFVPKLNFRMVSGSYFDGDGCEHHFYPQKLNGSQLYRAEDDTRTGTLTGPRFINAHSYSYYWRMATGIYTDDDHLYECWQSGEQKQESDYGTTPPWQPCATNNADYEKLMLGLDRTITMIEKRGQKFTANISAMSFSICDNQKGYCACRNCTKKQRTEGYSGLYIDLTNRAARDVKVLYPEYPTLKLMSIIYDHSIPQTVRPEDNVIIFFCGQGCNNHPINSGECTGNKPLIHKLHNDAVVESLKAWAGFCHEAGAEIWFWYYPTSFLNYMAPCPNVLKLYYDFDFIINECKVDGVYFECGGLGYGFESLKSHLASEYIYDPDITYDEYMQILKDYLYIYYGAGYEYIYEYLVMQNEAGTKEECYLNNFNYPMAMYNMDYLEDNYVYMRELVLKALEMTDNAEETEHLEMLLVTCDFTGLSAVHESWYLEGANVERYKANYDEMCELIKKYDMRPNTFTDANGDPEQLDFTNYEDSPFTQAG